MQKVSASLILLNDVRFSTVIIFVSFISKAAISFMEVEESASGVPGTMGIMFPF